MTPARAPHRGPTCHCGRPLGGPVDVPGTLNHGPARIRRCEAGHTVVVLPEPDLDIDLRPCTSGDLEG